MNRQRLAGPTLPLLYFAFAHACLAAAGLFAAVAPTALGGFHYHPRLAAVVHLVTLGWITSSILGALLVLLPTALRSPLPQRRSDFVAFAAYAIGVVGMVAHFCLAEPMGLAWAAATVLPALAFYAARAFPAILRARAPAAVRGHLALALANLLVAALAGVLLGIHKVWPLAWLADLSVSSLSGAMGHAHLAAVGFVVMMVAGAGYRLLPMFLPAAMPVGHRLWVSAGLLQAGAWGLFAGLSGGARSAGWVPLAAALCATGVLTFLFEVLRMRRDPRPSPPALERPDWGMVQVGSALAWAVVAVGLGLFLAGSGRLWPGTAWVGPAALVYGVAGLLGFLGQMVAGVGQRLLPLYFWLSRVPAAGLPDSPFNPLRLPWRRGQAAGLAGWSLAVPLLALGLATHGRVATAFGGLALLAAALAGGTVLWRAGREAQRRVAAAVRELEAHDGGQPWDDRPMSEPVLATLERSPFFAALPAAARRALADAASPSEIRKQIQLFAQGDPADALVLVVAGKVRLAQTGEDGSEVVVRFVSPGEVFGCVALVDDARYPVSGDVVEAGEILIWPQERLRPIAADHPEVAMAATATIAGRMRELQERFREVSTQRVDQRVAKALGRLAAQTGRERGDAVVLDLPLSRLDLAEMTGTTLFTVSRLLSGWQRDGILDIGRQRVTILDPEALADLS